MFNKIKQFLSIMVNKLKLFIFKEKDEFLEVTRLPIGVTEFHEWADSIIAKSGLPPNASMKNALAHGIAQLDTNTSHVPKQFFISRLQKAAATQVAFHIMDEFKTKKLAASEAAKVLTGVEAPNQTTSAI